MGRNFIFGGEIRFRKADEENRWSYQWNVHNIASLTYTLMYAWHFRLFGVEGYTHNDNILTSLTLICMWGYTNAKSGILNSFQLPDIDQNLDRSLLNFQISDHQILHSCNSRANYDTDTKLGSLSKLEQRNAMTLKNVWRWSRVVKLWRSCHFSDLWLICSSNPKVASKRCMVHNMWCVAQFGNICTI